MQYKRRIHSVGLTGLSTWMLVRKRLPESVLKMATPLYKR